MMNFYGMFWSDNLEKSDQKSILSWRCHKFKRKRNNDKWNFAFVRLECERWQQLLHQCFQTLIVCRSLFVYSNKTLLELQTLLFLFFSKICTSNLGVRLIYGGLRYYYLGKNKPEWPDRKIAAFALSISCHVQIKHDPHTVTVTLYCICEAYPRITYLSKCYSQSSSAKPCSLCA